MWRITQEGRSFLKKHPEGIDESTLRELTQVPADSTLSPKDDSPAPATAKVRASPTQSPEEQIDNAIEELNESVAAELLRLIHDSSADFFERLVLDLLVAMGYGTPDIDAIQVGGSGDGGIDGVIPLDRLGLEKVYVQAKRWKHGNNVGRPEIQSFYGALAGRRAAKGVFITASDFSKDARDYVKQVSDSIVLIDGLTLTRLMIQYGVGVSVQRTVKIVDVNNDYFDEV